MFNVTFKSFIMSCKSLSEEMQKKYENEFSEFLIQRISHAGGSLQFQHLSGVLQQLRYEIRDAFGTTKTELMKFLRAHPKIFKIDSKGVVTAVGSISLDSCDNTDTDKCNSTSAKKTLLPKIENGVGVILKIFPEFCIIKAREPLETCVYFTPPEYGASKDSLFIDLDLEVNTEVCFSAVHGHKDYEIEYRATKVWRKCNSDNENSDYQNLKSNKNVNKLSGEGIIEKIFPKLGFISVLGNKKGTVLFYRNSVKNCDIDVTEFFEVGDCVEFTAKSVIIDSKTQWKATEVIKKMKKSKQNEKEPIQSSASSGTSVKIHDKYNIPKKKIENQLGKIYPYSHGAVIKFGKDYSELADGGSSDYFLYGSKVSDIAWEFSEGDDVLFDAVKNKNSPGWKSVLVWVGEKPACTNGNKENIDEGSDEITADQNYISSSDVLSESSNSSVRSRAMKSKFNVFNTKHKVRNESNILHDRSVSEKLHRSEEYRNNSETPETNSPKFSIKKSKYKKKNNKLDRENSPVSIYNVAKETSVAELTKSSNANENYNSLFSSGEMLSDRNLSGSNQNSSEEDNELQSIMHNFKKVVKEEEYELPVNTCTLKFTFKGFPKDEINRENKSCEVTAESPKNDIKKKADIKKFEDIEGEIIHLYCKVAIIKSSHLQKDADFVLNAFYLNGKSVEEQQVIDLKEVIKIGDIISFNCFEIIDDLGEIYQKVTMAWKGPKPKVYEITPEEFIAEHELSVSVSNVLNSEYIPEDKTSQKSFFSAAMSRTNSDETFEFHSETESSLNNINDDTLFKYPIESKNEICEKLEDDDLSSDVHHKLLSGRIIQRLKTYGFVSSISEVNLNIVHEIINLVLKESSIEEFSNSPVNKNSEMECKSEILCSSCAKRSELFSCEEATSKHAEVQTIITGEIIATRDEFRL